MIWRQQAACRGSELDFTSEDRREQARCLAVCRRCPVLEACYAAAVAADEVGVWGGEVLGGRYGHGTRTMYVKAKCRCEACRAANSRYSAERQAAQREQAMAS